MVDSIQVKSLDKLEKLVIKDSPHEVDINFSLEPITETQQSTLGPINEYKYIPRLIVTAVNGQSYTYEYELPKKGSNIYNEDDRVSGQLKAMNIGLGFIERLKNDYHKRVNITVNGLPLKKAKEIMRVYMEKMREIRYSEAIIEDTVIQNT